MVGVGVSTSLPLMLLPYPCTARVGTETGTEGTRTGIKRGIRRVEGRDTERGLGKERGWWRDRVWIWGRGRVWVWDRGRVWLWGRVWELGRPPFPLLRVPSISTSMTV
ncbi:hypothetical protein B484DRAFT_441961, partial [Ochromonadaceae sp. CCMP2298]